MVVNLKKLTLLSMIFALVMSLTMSFTATDAGAVTYKSKSKDGMYKYNVSNKKKGKLTITAVSSYKADEIKTQYLLYKKQTNGKYKLAVKTAFRKANKKKVVTKTINVKPGAYKVLVVTKYTKSKKTKAESTSLQAADFKKIK